MRIDLICWLALLLGLGDTQNVMARDEIALPPIQRSITSENGEFELIITRPERLVPDMFPKAVLYRIVPNSERTKVWDKTLNIYIGPRFAVVSNAGIVVLLDEWLRKVVTDYAIQVYGLDGSLAYNYKLEKIIPITGLNWPEIAETAKYGAWISTAPALLDSNIISFEVGGIPLILRIDQAVLEVQED